LNRGAYVVDCIRDLLAQDYRPLEILIVDQSGGPPPGLEGLPAAHRDLISYHKAAFRGLPEARNYGTQHARYNAIVFVDDDIRCGPYLVREHLRALRKPGVGVVAGGIEEVHGQNGNRVRAGTFRWWTASPLRGFSSREEHDAQHAPGGNFSVWRQVLAAAGGFDERLNMGAALYEETELCLRVRKAGFRVYFNGAARLTHLAAGDGGCRVRDIPAYVYGLAHNRAILIRRHVPAHFWPAAMARLALLVLSYAAHYQSPRAIANGLRGFAQGWRAAALPVKCTRFDAGGFNGGRGGPGPQPAGF
jgi:GT2 family glycosyltransferase